MASVREWAQISDYRYQFLDDALLELAPDWYRQKAGRCICVVTDVARLLLARNLLLDGADRVVWCDADMLVFRPGQFALDPNATGMYCKEVWVHRDRAGTVSPWHRVNNSVCVFGKADLPHLAQYIAQCYSVVQAAPQIVSQLTVGTDLLTASQGSRACIESVSMIGPHVMEAVLEDDATLLGLYRQWQGSPMYAANLCNAVREMFGEYPKLFDFLCMQTIVRLRAGVAGEVLSAA